MAHEKNIMVIPPYEEYLKQIKWNLRLTGIPYGESKIYFRYYILLFSLTIMAVLEILFLIYRVSSENLLELTQLIPCTCIGTLSIFKILAVSQKRQKIFKLTDSLDLLYNHILADTNKCQLVKHDLLFVNTLMKYFFLLNLILICVYNFLTPSLMIYHYLTTNKIVFLLPYSVLLPFSTDAWIPWAGVYFYSILCGFICVLYFTTVDGLYFVLTSHVCCNFRVISDIIIKLDKNNISTVSDVVKSHQYIFQLGEDLEDIFTLPNLFNVLVGSFEICALGFNLTTGPWQQIPGCLLFIISVLIQILTMSVFGENIIRESLKIGDAAYHCQWYNMDTVSKKFILTIMIRSQRPQRLTAYKFSTISYQSFTKIISTSWSYFTILKSVYKPPEQHQNN